IQVLETLGPTAAPAIPMLVETLHDPDRFVRWAAARALGKIGTQAAEAAVPRLTEQLLDPDVDLRLAAATALEQFGPASRGAVPLLARLVRGTGEPDLRLEAIRVLEVVGCPDAVPAVPVLAAVLTDRDARIRQAAAKVLGRFGPAARDAVDALQQARNDPSA